MAELTANFEAGVNGNEITTAGGEASASAWDVVNDDGFNSITYDNTRAANGTLSAKLAVGGISVVARLQWTTSLGTVTDHYGRIYLYATANPSGSGTADILICKRSGGTGTSWNARVGTDGKITLFDQAGGSPVTFTTAIALNQWIRVEYHSDNAGNSLEVKLFNTASSTSADETQTQSSIGADANEIWHGGFDLNRTVWLDAIVANATSYPGPVVTPSVTNLAPVIYGRGAC